MKKQFQLLAPLLLSLLVTHPAYAYLATPADADILDEIPLENDLLPEEPIENGGSNDVLLMEILSHVQSIDSNMLNNSTATPSDAGSLDSAENDVDAPGETTYFSYDALPAAQGGADNYLNVLRFDIIVDGTSYICLFPPEYIDSLYIDANNRLWNMSTKTVQGRIVDENFNPYATTGKLVYLTPCLGNNFSSIREYGSPNYLREYYWSGSRYTYDDTYTEIVVDKYYHTYFVSDFWNYIFLFLIGGGVLLLWLRTYKRY